MLKQRLLTNVERMRRGFGNDRSCTLCSIKLEDSLHAICDCVKAKEVWLQVIPIGKQRGFFLGSLYDWFGNNLQDK